MHHNHFTFSVNYGTHYSVHITVQISAFVAYYYSVVGLRAQGQPLYYNPGALEC